MLSRSINKHGHHRQFLFQIGRFLKIFFSETALPNEPKFDLVRSPYGRFCIKCPQSRMKGERQAQPTELLVLFANMMSIMVKIFIFQYFTQQIMSSRTSILKSFFILIYVRIRSTSNPQIVVQFSNIWPFFTFSNRHPVTSLTYTSNDVTPVSECF